MLCNLPTMWVGSVRIILLHAESCAQVRGHFDIGCCYKQASAVFSMEQMKLFEIDKLLYMNEVVLTG